MLKKLAVGAAIALAGLMMVASPVVAQPPPGPPPGWGPPGPPFGPPPPPGGFFGGPDFGIYIGPGPVGPPMFRPPPPPRGMYCDYRACAATYRSFDPRSCTYQPHYGPRRYCTVRW